MVIRRGSRCRRPIWLEPTWPTWEGRFCRCRGSAGCTIWSAGWPLRRPRKAGRGLRTPCRDGTEAAGRGRAVTLGWSPGQVQVVDADLGLSGAQAASREGFQELVAQVALGRVGLILGLEASRLARSNSDWYQLLDLCGMTDTLIADGDGIYDPAAYSDR